MQNYELDQTDKSQPNLFNTLKLVKTVHETKNAASLYLEIPPSLQQIYQFQPGQYVTVRAYIPRGQKQELVSRCYSFSDSPKAGQMRLTIKKVRGGVFSSWAVSHAREGSVLEVSRPLGSFTWQKDPASAFFFAAGSGITPCLSMVKWALMNTNTHISLLYANTGREEVIFKKELKSLQSMYPSQFDLHEHLDSNSGRITRDAIQRMVDRKISENTKAYLCGPAPFMDLAKQALLDISMHPNNILLESFDGSSSSQRPRPIAASNINSFSLKMGGEKLDLSYKQGETLLDSMLRQNIEAPYACKDGFCGTCICKVEEGSVSHIKNQVLSEQELKAGMSLSCQAVPSSTRLNMSIDLKLMENKSTDSQPASAIDKTRSMPPGQQQSHFILNQQKPGFSLPPEIYTNPEVFEEEISNIWKGRSWIYVGHEAQIPKPGDYFTYELSGDPLIISKQEDGSIKAFLNICRHRGAKLENSKKGNKKCFTCPYHGWVFNHSGNLKYAHNMDANPQFDKMKNGLKWLKSFVAEGFIFVSWSSSPINYTEIQDYFKMRLSPYQLCSTKVAYQKSFKLKANWKIFKENDAECNHCSVAHSNSYTKAHNAFLLYQNHHPDQESIRDHHKKMRNIWKNNGLEESAFVNGVNSGKLKGQTEFFRCDRIPLKPGHFNESKAGKPLSLPLGKLSEMLGAELAQGAGSMQGMVLPALYFHANADYVVILKTIPQSYNETNLEMSFLVNKNAQEGVDYHIDQLTQFWLEVAGEDNYMNELTQSGNESSFAESGELSATTERDLQAVHKWYKVEMGFNSCH